MTDPSHWDVEWCSVLYDSIVEGGTWAVPRSGMIFFKRGGGLVLVDTMPWETGMPITKEDLERQQRGEYDVIKEHFEAAGIPVTSEVDSVLTIEQWAAHLTLRHGGQFELETPSKKGVLLGQIGLESIKKMHAVLHEKMTQDHSASEV